MAASVPSGLSTGETHVGELLAEDLGGAGTVMYHSRPSTPASVSASFRMAGDRIQGAELTPRKPRPAELIASRRSESVRMRMTPSEGKMQTALAHLLLKRSNSSLSRQDCNDSRFREHGPVFQSTYRSISSCSFGRASRKICEQDVKEKQEKETQNVIRHDHLRKTNGGSQATSSMSKSKRGHWSQQKALPHGKWSQSVQRGHHSPPGSPHTRDMIFHRTERGNQELHDFFA